MSTRAALSRKGGGDPRINVPRALSIEKSLSELDTLLAMEEVSIASVRTNDTSGQRSGASRKSEGASDKENKASRGRRQEHNHERRTRSSRSLPSSPRRKTALEFGDDTKSTGSNTSNTIGSRDVTVYSHELIANMEQIQDQLALSLSDHAKRQELRQELGLSSSEHQKRSSPRSRKSRGSRSSSANSQRTRRGTSLEREISRMILQQTCDSSRFVVGQPQKRTKSANDILSDLMASPLPTSPLEATGQQANQELWTKSLLDEEDDDTTAETPSLGEEASVGSGVISQDHHSSSVRSNGSPKSVFSNPELSQFDAPTANTTTTNTHTTATTDASTEDEDVFAGCEESSPALQQPELKSEFERSFGTSLEMNHGDKFIDFSATTIIEESESDMADSQVGHELLAKLIPATTFLSLGPAPNSPTNEENVPKDVLDQIELTSTNESTASEQDAEEQVETDEERPVDLAPNMNLDGITFAFEDMEDSVLVTNFNDDDWTTFDNSAFAKSFQRSGGDDETSQQSPVPSEIGEPNSPTSVLVATTAASSKKLIFSDQDVTSNASLSQPAYYASSDPGLVVLHVDEFPLQPSSSSDSGVEWQEYNRRFVI